MKTLVYSTGSDFVVCSIRGDLEINETKLKNYLKTKVLFLATDEELLSLGIIKGFASPVKQTIRVIADLSVAESSNLTAGANRIDYHATNVNFGRDWTTKEVVDISSVEDGEACPSCGKPLQVTRGIEVGNIFKLGTKYSASMKAKFLDSDGKEKPMIMGCYGIGVGRLMASVLEVAAQENKILWPVSIAPFEVSLLALSKGGNKEVDEICATVYEKLFAHGIEVLYDDRDASPGFKFKDADLIGSPITVAVGEKSLAQGGVEVTIGFDEKKIIAVDEVVEFVKKSLDALHAKLLD